MKDERKIRCNPKVATKLQQALDFALKIYSVNFEKTYYNMLANVYAEIDPQACSFLKEVADCFDKGGFAQERFEEYYAHDLFYKYHIFPATETAAARAVYNVFAETFDTMEVNTKISSPLTKAEQLSVEKFFRTIKNPITDSNLCIPDGSVKCAYDRMRDRDISFCYSGLLKQMVEHMKDAAAYIIEEFALPNEPEKSCEEIEKE